MLTKIFGVVVLSLLVVFAFLGCGTTTPEKVDEKVTAEKAEEAAETETSAAAVFAIGDTVKMGDLAITLNSVRWDEGTEMIQPIEGEKWLVFDVTLENAGDEPEMISSMLMFALYDKEGYKKGYQLMANTKGSLDAELGPGRKLRGEIAFVVEEGEDAWDFIFEPNILGFGQAIYSIGLGEVQE